MIPLANLKSIIAEARRSGMPPASIASIIMFEDGSGSLFLAAPRQEPVNIGDFNTISDLADLLDLHAEVTTAASINQPAQETIR